MELIRALVVSQIKVRFRHSALGFGWFVLNPLLLMLVYAFVFSALFSEQRADYKLFLLAGLFPWQAMTAGLTASVRSLIMGGDLLKKTPFPSEALPISTALTSIFNLFIVMSVYILFLAVRGFPVLSQIHWVLVALGIQTALLLGLALLLSSLNVYLRDVEQIVGFGIWIWFFLTPIIFPLQQIYGARGNLILFGNPMAPVVSTIQKALLSGEAPPVEPLLASVAITSVILGAGIWVFRRFQWEYAKEV